MREGSGFRLTAGRNQLQLNSGLAKESIRLDEKILQDSGYLEVRRVPLA